MELPPLGYRGSEPASEGLQAGREQNVHRQLVGSLRGTLRIDSHPSGRLKHLFELPVNPFDVSGALLWIELPGTLHTLNGDVDRSI
jgi:hypothetical protein